MYISIESVHRGWEHTGYGLPVLHLQPFVSTGFFDIKKDQKTVIYNMIRSYLLTLASCFLVFGSLSFLGVIGWGLTTGPGLSTTISVVWFLLLLAFPTVVVSNNAAAPFLCNHKPNWSNYLTG